MIYVKRRILPENLHFALTVCTIPLVCDARLFEQTTPFHVDHQGVNI